MEITLAKTYLDEKIIHSAMMIAEYTEKNYQTLVKTYINDLQVLKYFKELIEKEKK